jgi:hypothetical protein
MKPVIGQAYEVAPGWFVALKSARRAIVVRRAVEANPFYAGNDDEESKEWFIYRTATTARDTNGWDVQITMVSAIEAAEWTRLPHAWGGMATHKGYTTLHEAVEGISICGEDVDFDFGALIDLLGHAGPYEFVWMEERSNQERYWTAAAARTPDMSVIKRHLHGRLDWREWALRLGAVHGRPLSSMEHVQLCMSTNEYMREFGMMASSSETPAAPRAKRPHPRGR